MLLLLSVLYPIPTAKDKEEGKGRREQLLRVIPRAIPQKAKKKGAGVYYFFIYASTKARKEGKVPR